MTNVREGEWKDRGVEGKGRVGEGRAGEGRGGEGPFVHNCLKVVYMLIVFHVLQFSRC